MTRALAVAAVVLGGCIASVDGGVLTHPTAMPKGAALGGHFGMGGGEQTIFGVDLDTRVDIASGGSRWSGGVSALGGIAIVPKFVLDARVGIWKAIVSSSSEATVVPTFELGGYVRLHEEKYDPQHPHYGSSDSGVVFGVREDLDDASYFTMFVGYAIFLMPGY